MSRTTSAERGEKIMRGWKRSGEEPGVEGRMQQSLRTGNEIDVDEIVLAGKRREEKEQSGSRTTLVQGFTGRNEDECELEEEEKEEQEKRNAYI